MRKAVVIGCAMLVFASVATAQAPTRGNVFIGYSYYNADWLSSGRSNLNGWTGSLEGKVFPHVGIVVDFSQAFSENVTILCPGLNCPIIESAHEYNIIFGPRVSFSVGKLRPFAEALFGVGHVGTNGGSNTSFAKGWVAASTTASSARSRCVSKETTSIRASSARLRTTCACRRASCFASEPRLFP